MDEYWRKFKYPSAYKLYKIMRKAGREVTLSDVDEFVRSQSTHQLHTKTRHNIQGHILAFSKNSLWFADLLDLQNFSRGNKGYRYILLCIDVFTRMGYAQPLRAKSQVKVKEGLASILSHVKTPISLIITDSGKEFLNRDVHDLLKEYNIIHDTVEVGDHHALGIIDRFSRTIKEMIFKDFTEHNTTVWFEKLQEYMTAYNNSPHRGILNLIPEEAQLPQNESKIYDLNIEKEDDLIQDIFNIGDTVRKRLKRPMFTKGYKQIWSSRVYTIESIDGVRAQLTNAEVIKLNDLQKVPNSNGMSEAGEAEEVTEVTRNEKTSKLEKAIKREGLDNKNIIQRHRRQG